MQKTKTTSYTQLLLLVMCSVFFIYALAQRSIYDNKPDEPEIQIPELELVATDVTGYSFSGSEITNYTGNEEFLQIPMCYSIGHSNSYQTGTITFYSYGEAFDFLQENMTAGSQEYYNFYRTINTVSYPYIYTYSIEVPTFIAGTDYVVSIISDSCFSENTQIREVILPTTLEYIGNFAFQNCSNLEYVDFNKNLISIGDSAFWGTELRTLTNLPDNLQEIKPYAFLRCRNLTEVVIPYQIKELILGVFHDCTSLRRVEIKSYYEIRIFLSNPYQTFSKCPNLEAIFIREELLDYYLNSDWNIYADKFVPTHFEGD